MFKQERLATHLFEINLKNGFYEADDGKKPRCFNDLPDHERKLYREEIEYYLKFDNVLDFPDYILEAFCLNQNN